MKILVNALSGIGDAIMFTPSLKKLSEDLPEAEIDALVMYKSVQDIYERLPFVNKILYWNFLSKPKFDSLRFVLGLRGRYNTVINVYPSNRKEYNLISFLTGAKKRVGVKYLRKDFSNFGFLNNIRITENDLLHNVEENILLCEALTGKPAKSIGPLVIEFGENENKFAEDWLAGKKIASDKIVFGFHPGCSTLKNHDKRRWETDKFARLAEQLIEKYNATVLLFGGPEERNLKEEIISFFDSKEIIAVETESLIQTAALMKRCNLFVTNDSSLMHVAAALKLDTVAIIGPTNPNYIRPWQTNHKIASLNLECSPCFYYSPKPLTCNRKDVQFKCIRELDVETVFRIIGKMLPAVN